MNKPEQVRILFLGKTGAGKSASGNTILGEKFFEEYGNVESNCQKTYVKTKIINETEVLVIDTPGIFNTSMTVTDVIYQIKLGLEFSKPGVHIILLVIKLNTKFTREEQEAVEFIEKNLGEKAQRHIMILFTYGDTLGDPDEIDSHLYKSQNLKNLVDKYNSRYHVFNNRSRDPTQVVELLQKIDQLMRRNGDRLYIKEMFEVVQQNNEIEREEAKKEKEQREKAETTSMLMGITGAVVGGIVTAVIFSILKQ